MTGARRKSNQELEDRLDAIVEESEHIGAMYWSSTGSLAVTADNKINFDSKEYDSHNAVTTGVGVWQFQAPKDGLYLVCGAINFSGSGTVRLYKNGTAFKILGFDTAAVDSSYSGLIRLVAGEIIDVRPSTSINVAGNANNAQSPSNINITRIAP